MCCAEEKGAWGTGRRLLSGLAVLDEGSVSPSRGQPGPAAITGLVWVLGAGGALPHAVLRLSAVRGS